MSKSTMIELVKELELLPNSEAINLMIKEAKAGEYHDFKNDKYACGKMESSARLRSLGYPELACRIEQGEFDEKPDDIDIQRLKNDIGDGPTSKVMRELLGL